MSSSDPASYIVLVVEDDPLIRMAAVDIVIDAEGEVFEAANADEAIAILDAHPEITVLFTDIDMPGSMDGLRLAKVAKERRPELVIVLASGHLTPGSALPDGWMFFPKPYCPTQVATAIRTIAVSTLDRRFSQRA
jgi:DNA-binding NtrC family response regulator